MQAQKPAVLEYATVSTFHWGLFKGKINQRHLHEMGGNTGAVTVSSISYTALQISPHEATVTITARFHPEESWTRYPKLQKPEEALEHEKKHFELTEVYARKLRKLVSNSHYSATLFKDEINKQFTELVTQHRTEQVRYDHETNHSIDSHQQEKWNARIDEQLGSLSTYTETTVRIKFTR
ncbi:MAG: DUF922 domain-containing protein [Saprospiraceae bacterium]|nr:DUF922 domain-containing protein [Saprospiraceae bacterium]